MPGDRYTRLAGLLVGVYVVCFVVSITLLMTDCVNLLEYFGIFFFIDKVSYSGLDYLQKLQRKNFKDQ